MKPQVMKVALILASTVVLCACDQRAPEEHPVQFTFSGGDGSSPTSEVFIVAEHLDAVRAAQKAWLNEKYPGLRTYRSGWTAGMGFREHEMFDVTTATGLTIQVYFAYPQRLPK
jgi:hypothetical protein